MPQLVYPKKKSPRRPDQQPQEEQSLQGFGTPQAPQAPKAQAQAWPQQAPQAAAPRPQQARGAAQAQTQAQVPAPAWPPIGPNGFEFKTPKTQGSLAAPPPAEGQISGGWGTPPQTFDPADENQDGTVDAQEQGTWDFHNQSQTQEPPVNKEADYNGDGQVDAQEQQEWQDRQTYENSPGRQAELAAGQEAYWSTLPGMDPESQAKQAADEAARADSWQQSLDNHQNPEGYNPTPQDDMSGDPFADGRGEPEIDEIRAMYENALEMSDAGLEAQLSGATADEAQAYRRNAEMNAGMGASVGGGFMGGAVQAQLGGEQARMQARGEHYKQQLDLKMRTLEMMLQRAQANDDNALQLQIQQEISATQMQQAALEHKAQMLTAQAKMVSAQNEAGMTGSGDPDATTGAPKASALETGPDGQPTNNAVGSVTAADINSQDWMGGNSYLPGEGKYKQGMDTIAAAGYPFDTPQGKEAFQYYTWYIYTHGGTSPSVADVQAWVDGGHQSVGLTGGGNTDTSGLTGDGSSGVGGDNNNDYNGMDTSTWDQNQTGGSGPKPPDVPGYQWVQDSDGNWIQIPA